MAWRGLVLYGVASHRHTGPEGTHARSAEAQPAAVTVLTISDSELLRGLVEDLLAVVLPPDVAHVFAAVLEDNLAATRVLQADNAAPSLAAHISVSNAVGNSMRMRPHAGTKEGGEGDREATSTTHVLEPVGYIVHSAVYDNPSRVS